MASADKFSGYIFMCNGTTKADCYRYRVFGLPAGRLDAVKKIQPQMKLFLYDFDLKLLYGVYTALSHGDMGLEPFAFGGRYPAQVKFGIFKECLPLPENVFKHAIKDNYNGGPKFRTELSDEQVNNLVSMFCPLFVQPLVAPSLVSDGRYVQQGQVASPIIHAPARRACHRTREHAQTYFPERDHQQRHSRHNEIEGRGVLHPGSAAYWAAVASEDSRHAYVSVPDNFGRQNGFQSVTAQHGSGNVAVGGPILTGLQNPGAVYGASECPSLASVNSQTVAQQTAAMGSKNATSSHQLAVNNNVSELIRVLHENMMRSGGTPASLNNVTPASMSTHSSVPLQNVEDSQASMPHHSNAPWQNYTSSHVYHNDATLPSNHASMSTHDNAPSQNNSSSHVFTHQPASTGPANEDIQSLNLSSSADYAHTGSISHGFAHPLSSSQVAAHSTVVPCHQTQQSYQVSSATHNMPYHGAQTQDGAGVLEYAHPSAVYWQGVTGQEFYDPNQVNSTAQIWSSGDYQTQTGSNTYGTHQAYYTMPMQESGVAYGMPQYDSSIGVAHSVFAAPNATQQQAYYGHH